MPEQDEAKTIKVYGDKHFKEYRKTHPVPPAYERQVHARSVTFTCQRCQQDVTEVRFPGPRPAYCVTCAVVVKREKTAARTRRSRRSKKEQQELPSS